MDDAPAARRDLDEAGPAPAPDPTEVPGPPPPTWPMADVDHDPVAEAGRLLGIARQALDAGVDVPPETRLRPAKEAMLRALQPVTTVQHRVDDHVIGSVDILVKETRSQWLRTSRLVTGMATVDMALDVTDHQLRALREEVAALRHELAELRRAVAPDARSDHAARDDRDEPGNPTPAP